MKKETNKVALMFGLGIIIGPLIGVVIDNIGLGISLFWVPGAIILAIQDKNKKNNKGS